MTTLHRVHRKSGLARELNATDVFLINTFGYALGIALTINPGLIGGFAPSANIYLVLSLGLIAALFNGFTYGLFAAVMPKTGGDFVYVTESLGRWLGFIASFGFTLAQLYGFGLNSFWAFKQGLSPGLATFGMIARDPRLTKWATVVGADRVSFYLSIGLMVSLFVISWFGLGFSKRVLIVAFAIGLLGPSLQLCAFLAVDHDGFVLLYDNFIKSQHLTGLDYQTVIELGRKQNLVAHSTRTLTDSLKALPLGFLTFLGFTYSAYMGSEVREASRSQLRGIFSALLFGAAFFYIAMGRYYKVVGNDFNAAISATGLQFPNGNSLMFFAGIILKNPIANALMNIGTLLWFVLVPFVILQVCSRNIHVWAVEYMLPQRVATTNKFGVPGAAALVALTFGIAFVSLAAFVLKNYNPIGAVALSAVSIFLSGISAIVYAKRRESGSRGQFLFSSTAFRFFGYGTVIMFLWVGYAAFRFPAISGLATESEWSVVLKLVVFVYLIGTGIFFWSRHALVKQLAKEGLTLDEIWGHLLDE